MITTKDFKIAHSLSDSTFTRLVKRVQVDYPDRPITRKVSSQIWEVVEPTLLESYISKPKAETVESIEAEIVGTQELCNGLTLLTRNEMMLAPILPDLEIRTEMTRIDTSAVDGLMDKLKSDLLARQEADRITKLYEHAQNCQQEKKQRDLIEILIAQGYSAEQALTIAQGAKNLQPVGK